MLFTSSIRHLLPLDSPPPLRDVQGRWLGLLFRLTVATLLVTGRVLFPCIRGIRKIKRNVGSTQLDEQVRPLVALQRDSSSCLFVVVGKGQERGERRANARVNAYARVQEGSRL